MTMPWSNPAVSLIIVEAGGGFTGFFMYSGAPAANNLVASIAPANGTDSFGNAYLSGFTTYGLISATYYALQTGFGGSAGILRLYSASSEAGPWVTANSQITFGANDLTIFTGTPGNSGGEFAILSGTTLQLGQNVTAVATEPGTVDTPESWHSLGSPSATGFSSGHGRYRMSPEGEVEFDIQLSTGGGAGTAGTYTYANTLPSAYQPANIRVYPLARTDTVGAGSNFPCLIIHASGQVQIQLPGVAANNQAGGQAFMPLD